MLSLPEPDSSRLARSPLQLVVCQVRFEEIPSVADPRIALAIHDRLGGRSGRYPVLEQLKGEQVEVKVGIGGAPISTQQVPMSGWRLLTQDRDWTAALLPGSVALETTNYTTWADDFGPRLSELLAAAAAVIAPTMEQRLGLRYVDLLTEPEVLQPAGWRGHVADELLGPILHPSLGAGVRSAQQQVEFDAGAGIRCTLRHGVLADRSVSKRTNYLLDWDVFREEARPFDAEDLKAAAASFNRLALQLFQQALTPDMFEFLREAGA